MLLCTELIFAESMPGTSKIAVLQILNTVFG